MRIEGEPEQKGLRGSRSALAFQQQVVEQMMALSRRPFTGPVALDLHFTSRRKNPPAIHNVAKHVLDLLDDADPAGRPRRRSVLYRDDRQVKFLYVGLDQAWNQEATRAKLPSSLLSGPWDSIAPLSDDGERTDVGSRPITADLPADQDGSRRRVAASVVRHGHTYLIARPGRDVAADLTIANRLRRDDENEDDESSPFWSPNLPDDVEEEEWGSVPGGSTNAPLWGYIERSSRFYRLADLQKAVLRQIDASLALGLCMYLDGVTRALPTNVPETHRSISEEHLRDARTMSRRQLLGHPLTLSLPGLPRNSREGKEFENALRRRMEEFKEHRPLFDLLLVPVKVTFLVVPPEQGKDLDNIALTVLPIVHEVLKPHVEPHLLAPTHPDGPPPWRAEAMRRLRSLNVNSVTAYQVIELPRTSQDPPEGVLRFALGADSRRSWWDQVADHVDKRIADADDLHDRDLGHW
ncbi:RusA family crossover junction endodeoxyribonuclease [Planotetraspora mira]|nr:hypothetical protein [Planotetraspora mira]